MSNLSISIWLIHLLGGLGKGVSFKPLIQPSCYFRIQNTSRWGGDTLKRSRIFSVADVP